MNHHNQNHLLHEHEGLDSRELEEKLKDPDLLS
jgi:hypothetical protein